MKRRDALKLMGYAGSAVMLSPFGTYCDRESHDDVDVEDVFQRLEGEPRSLAEVKVERGGPRLFINGREVYPFAALSTALTKTGGPFTKGGINIFAPIVGMKSGWKGPGQYDWSILDAYLAKLLVINPDCFFILRTHINTPRWWRDAHPDELIQYGLTPDPEGFNLEIELGDNGYPMGSGAELSEASWASDIWKKDTGEMLNAYIAHIQGSPLSSRVIGYQPTTGFTGEWGYFGAHFIPDYSAPMRRVCGDIPDAASRISTTYGLLRDPAVEQDIIDFYAKYHQVTANAILYFANVVKKASARRSLVGVYYTYLLENVIIQEIGNLAPEPVLKSRDIDYIASPYSYVHTNQPDVKRWTSDIYDDAMNWLGRARGVGGDAADRVLLESVKRNGKLYMVEMDPSTYLEKKPYSEGGSGHRTKEGTLLLLERDFAKMFAAGYGGWLYDFGPRRGGVGWYTSKPIVKLIKKYSEIGKMRSSLNTDSVADMAAVYNAKSFFATQHWKTSAPYDGHGCYYIDYINNWFLAFQLRTYNRMAAPMDYLYQFDMTRNDPKKYKLIFAPNLYYMSDDEVDYLKEILKGSGTTVVWYYAPAFVAPGKLDLRRMESLTGFGFSVLEESGPMMINAQFGSGEKSMKMDFGVSVNQFPRFVVNDKKAEVLGHWIDDKGVAFARREMDGWTSIYAGTAPLPVEILRVLAAEAGVRLWSNKADIVMATEDAAMLLATEDGDRSLSLHKPMKDLKSGETSEFHDVAMEFGEVRLFANV